MKNIAKADRPKSAIAILPPRPFRGSGKVAQTAFKSARRDGKSFIHMANHVFNDLGIPKISPTATFRIAGGKQRDRVEPRRPAFNAESGGTRWLNSFRAIWDAVSVRMCSRTRVRHCSWFV